MSSLTTCIPVIISGWTDRQISVETLPAGSFSKLGSPCLNLLLINDAPHLVISSVPDRFIRLRPLSWTVRETPWLAQLHNYSGSKRSAEQWPCMSSSSVACPRLTRLSWATRKTMAFCEYTHKWWLFCTEEEQNSGQMRTNVACS